MQAKPKQLLGSRYVGSGKWQVGSSSSSSSLLIAALRLLSERALKTEFALALSVFLSSLSALGQLSRVHTHTHTEAGRVPPCSKLCVSVCVHTERKEIMCQSCAKRVFHFKIACPAPSNGNNRAPLHASHLLTETEAEHIVICLPCLAP